MRLMFPILGPQQARPQLCHVMDWQAPTPMSLSAPTLALLRLDPEILWLIKSSGKKKKKKQKAAYVHAQGPTWEATYTYTQSHVTGHTHAFYSTHTQINPLEGRPQKTPPPPEKLNMWLLLLRGSEGREEADLPWRRLVMTRKDRHLCRQCEVHGDEERKAPLCPKAFPKAC